MTRHSIQINLLGYGWLIQRNGIEIAHGFGIFSRKRKVGSNIAEYLALIEGLEALADLRIHNEQIDIRGDAKCVIDQMTGNASVSSYLTRKLNRRAQKLIHRFSSLSWVRVPWRENKQADVLSRRGLGYVHFILVLEESQLAIFYDGSLIPLVDLRVHSQSRITRTFYPTLRSSVNHHSSPC